MAFDTSLTFGNVITIVTLVFSFVAAWYAVKSDIRAIEGRLARAEDLLHTQIEMNAKMLAEVGAVRQDVAVIRDRLEPPPMSVQSPSKGGGS